MTNQLINIRGYSNTYLQIWRSEKAKIVHGTQVVNTLICKTDAGMEYVH